MLWLLSIALADMIGPAPEGCLKGSFGVSDHAGEWCAPSECSSDDDCRRGGCVADVGLCVVESVEDCSTEDPDCTFTKREALAPCTPEAPCTAGTCQVVSRCVEPSAREAIQKATQPLKPKRCGCSTGLQGWVAGLMGAVVLLLARVR